MTATDQQHTQPRRAAAFLAASARLLLLIVFLSALGSAFTALAVGNLMLYPTRVVFEGRERAAHLDLINNGDRPMTYRLAFVQKRMNETGEFQEIDTPQPGEKFADGLIRYSPRQVTLMPGATQIIRLMVRKPADLEAGEYRSHMLFSQMPENTGSSVLAEANSEKKMGVTLTPLIAVSIPIIVRHGNLQATVTLTNLELQPAEDEGPPLISLRLERSGDRSVFGDIIVTVTSDDGQVQRIGQANGVAVYTPNLLRRIRLPLEKMDLAQIHGILQVTYQETQEEGGKVLAQATMPLPPR